MEKRGGVSKKRPKNEIKYNVMASLDMHTMIYIGNKEGIEASHIHFNALELTKPLIARARQKLFIKKIFEDLKCYFPNSNHYTKRAILVLCIGISQIKFFCSGFQGCFFSVEGRSCKSEVLKFFLFQKYCLKSC